jgi:hypothetical protein
MRAGRNGIELIRGTDKGFIFAVNGPGPPKKPNNSESQM